MDFPFSRDKKIQCHLCNRVSHTYLPPAYDGKVMVSVCLSDHQEGGGVPKSGLRPGGRRVGGRGRGYPNQACKEGWGWERVPQSGLQPGERSGRRGRVSSQACSWGRMKGVHYVLSRGTPSFSLPSPAPRHRRTDYAAAGSPLAVSQEDFLVPPVFQIDLIISDHFKVNLAVLIIFQSEFM